MKEISVKVEHQYKVLVGAGLLGEAGKLIADVDSKIQKLMIVSDSHVAPLYLAELRGSLEAAGFEVFDFVFEAGEQSKILNTIGDILGALAGAAFTRTDAIVALGGGVATDMAGFAASIFLRGIKVFQIPTSLLAQVDASVGGKTGVDLPEGKNLVGAFWQPSLVIADTGLLASAVALLNEHRRRCVYPFRFLFRSLHVLQLPVSLLLLWQPAPVSSSDARYTRLFLCLRTGYMVMSDAWSAKGHSGL